MDIFEEYAKLVGKDRVNELKEQGRFIGNIIMKLNELSSQLEQANKRIQELESEVIVLKNVNI